MKIFNWIRKDGDDRLFDFWNEASAFAVMGLPVVISKNRTEKGYAGTPVESGLFRRSVGTPKGQVSDWRSVVPDSHRGIHVVEYSDRYEIHSDRFDPSVKPLEHLLFDSGKQVAAMLSVYAVTRLLGKRKRQ
ncbi:MAG: hypothetical protein ACP5NK_06770 [Thermoplasmata archaeon]